MASSFASLKSAIFDREEKKQYVQSSLSSNFLILSIKFDSLFFFSSLLNFGFWFRQYQAHIRGLNAYERHKKFIKDYGTDETVRFVFEIHDVNVKTNSFVQSPIVLGQSML